MSVIAPDEKANFVAILHRRRVDEADFLLQETATPEIVDDVYPIQGYVSVVRKSTLKEKEYRIGHGTAWTVEFEKDLKRGAFG